MMDTEDRNNTEIPESSEERSDVHSTAVRAGKRTYFFDVKATRNDDYYLTLTESKRRPGDDASYEKHKIFLYREDFTKFLEGSQESIAYVVEHKGEVAPRNDEEEE